MIRSWKNNKIWYGVWRLPKFQFFFMLHLNFLGLNLFTTRNHVHAFAACVQINHFCNYRYDCPLWYLIKMTCTHINNYKVVCNYICDLDLQLILIWMKMKMKSTFISSIFNGIPKLMKMYLFLWLRKWCTSHWTSGGIFSTWFVIISPSYKCMCN